MLWILFFSLHFLAVFSKRKLILLFSTPISNVTRSFLVIFLFWQAFIVSPSLQISLLSDLLVLLEDPWKYCIKTDLAHVPGSVPVDTSAQITWRVGEEVMMVFIPMASTNLDKATKPNKASIKRTSGVRGDLMPMGEDEKGVLGWSRKVGSRHVLCVSWGEKED